jgi:hypothetical protein
MAEFTTFWYGFLVFIIFTINAIFVSFYGGFLIDTIHATGETLPGSTSDFAQQSSGQVYWFINLFYLICYAWPVLGGLVFAQAILKKGRTSQYIYR